MPSNKLFLDPRGNLLQPGKENDKYNVIGKDFGKLIMGGGGNNDSSR